VDIEFLDIYYKVLPLVFTVGGGIFAIFLYHFNINSYYKIKVTKKYNNIYTFFNKK